MKCEKCQQNHDGSFATGRFCSPKCARSFSANVNREETNKKVSDTLKRKILSGELKPPSLPRGYVFKKGYDPNRRPFNDEDRKKARVSCKLKWEKYIQDSPFEKLSRDIKKRILLSEQNEKCLCGINEWKGIKLSLQLDHIDGNKNNEQRENLRLLCPNCHSITPTYGGKNLLKKTATDDELWNAIKSHPNIHRALKSLGINNGRNYSRAQRMVLERGIEPLKL